MFTVKAAVAGTFNVLHEGHKALLDHAMWIADELYIGITSDKMASESRDEVVPFYLRKKAVEEYVASKNEVAIVFEIDDIYGPPEIMDSIDTLVVSEETQENGELVSRMRVKRGLNPMKISVVNLVSDSHGRKLSATDIMKGDMSRDGKEDAIRIAVGSANRVKVEAVRDVMESIYGSVRIYAKDVRSGVPEQPFGDETHQGAVNRAKAAIGDRDLSVGIEAGVFEMYGELIDIQHCAILDKEGRITIGMGSGFAYPPAISKLVREGMTVGQAVDRIYEGESIGHSEGAIGYLSGGRLDRKDLTKQSVLAAMIPRLEDD
ncbi:MAG: inosine/xanthosine triphosphatase [Candidatus Methanomethylophilaceae archaeon]|nr:inosine/xanthosine triphosphatase [Candidatus Methanomethylophilaceae archaeon]